jgi:glycosyltransferase involved in cell wall biosynthesis
MRAPRISRATAPWFAVAMNTMEAAETPRARPELFIELARRLPAYQFRMIGGLSEALLAPLREQAAGLTNIEFTGFVPFVEVESHFDGASILVNTSSNEGFPNTFLQAWSRGIPSVSMFDPGTSQDGARVGEICASVEEMAQRISSIKSDTALWESLGQSSKRYFSQNFSVSQAIESYDQHFKKALG